MAIYVECPSCGNQESGDTIYQCKNCGRIGCSECANPSTSDGDWEIGTCFCGGDKNDFDRNRLFTVKGHIESDDDEDYDDDDDYDDE